MRLNLQDGAGSQDAGENEGPDQCRFEFINVGLNFDHLFVRRCSHTTAYVRYN